MPSAPAPSADGEAAAGDAASDTANPAATPADALLVAAIAGPPSEAQRRAVAKAITLIESTRPEHRERADALLAALPVPRSPSLRLGISGVPGVGKSTLIEALGLHVIAAGHRVAVLAVDPSSSVSGGSILGDKTRMERLSVQERAFVRPSPSGGTLGGVAAATREAIRVVEAAGYGVVVVETVGVGQSEAAVAGMTDLFVLLQLPNAGDELQAIKKGVMELADLVVVNKADLDAHAAARAAGQIENALHMAMPRRAAAGSGSDSGSDSGGSDDVRVTAKVLRLSALDPDAVAGFWTEVEGHVEAQRAGDRFWAKRRSQVDAWLWERLDAGLRARFRADAAVRAAWPATLAEAEAGRLPVSVAARRLLAAFFAASAASATSAASDESRPTAASTADSSSGGQA